MASVATLMDNAQLDYFSQPWCISLKLRNTETRNIPSKGDVSLFRLDVLGETIDDVSVCFGCFGHLLFWQPDVIGRGADDVLAGQIVQGSAEGRARGVGLLLIKKTRL